MSLQAELEERFKGSAERLPPDVLKTMLDVTRRLVDSGIAEKALNVGDRAPDFNLPSATGEEVKLNELLDKGPVILNFYRGGWCPYCNLELNAYQKRISDINELGASLVAISPETPDNSLTTTEKGELKFQVLSDVGNKVAGQFGLVFTVPSELQKLYDKFGIDVPKYNGDESWTLPMPGTYVLDKDGTVSYAYVDADYTKRAEPDEVIAKLKEISNKE